MNIFDWHENKSPEELAKELGISDLAVIENAGREVIETLSKEEIAKEIIEEENDITIETIVDRLRTSDYSFEDLEKGMTLKLMNGDEIIITEIENEDKIHTTRGKWEETIMPYTAIENISLLSTYELDWKNDDKWISLSDIYDIYKTLPEDLIANWTFVCNKSEIIFSNKIAKASKYTNMGVLGYDLHFPFSTEWWNKDNFIEKLSIHKDHFAQYQLWRADIGENLQTTKAVNNVKDIKRWDKVVNLREGNKDYIVREITYIWPIRDITQEGVKLKNWDGEEKIIDIRNLKQNYQLIVNFLDTNNPELWTSECDFENIENWMRVNILLDNLIGEIVNIDYGSRNLTVLDANNHNKVMNFNSIWNNFSVSLEDIRDINKENFDFIWISQLELKNDSLWEKYKNVYHANLQEDVRVRKNGEAGKILDVDGNIVSVQYVNNINGYIYLASPDSWFEIFKEDVEKGMQ